MSGIQSRGRRGDVIVPNWRCEDQSLDAYEFRIACWLASHAGEYRTDWVTRNEVARRTGVSQGKVSSALRVLETAGIISIEDVPTAKWRGGHRFIITFDFDEWRTGRVVTGSAEGSGREVTASTAKPGREVTALIEEHKEREEEQVSNSLSVVTEAPGQALVKCDDSVSLFDRFYAAYPRKVGKPAARRAFAAAVRKAGVDDISVGFKRWKAFWADNAIAGEFVPHPATWLNQERWNDDPGPPPRGQRLSIASQTARALERGRSGQAPPLPEFGSRPIFDLGAPRAI